MGTQRDTVISDSVSEAVRLQAGKFDRCREVVRVAYLDFVLHQIRRGTRQHVRESKGKMRLAIGGRLFSQAGSPRGSSEATIRLVPILCKLSKIPVGAGAGSFVGEECPVQPSSGRNGLPFSEHARRSNWMGVIEKGNEDYGRSLKTA